MKLTCEICGSELQMASGKEGAVCTGCGIAYSVERLREMLGNSQHANTNANKEKTTATERAEVNSSANAVRYLHLKRKVDLHICKIAVIIDGEQVAILEGQGKVTSIPIHQGEHTITMRVASAGGLLELEEQTIRVGECDWAGEVGLFRGAFKASYGYKIYEMK